MAFKLFKNDDELIEKELSKYEVEDDDTIEDEIVEDIVQQESLCIETNKVEEQPTVESVASVVEMLAQQPLEEYSDKVETKDEIKTTPVEEKLKVGETTEESQLEQTRVFEKKDTIKIAKTIVEKEEQTEVEEVEDDEEYEYVTPHYLRNGIMLALLFTFIGCLVTFIIAKPMVEQKIKSAYIEKGYILTDNATAEASDIRQGKTAYIHGKLVQGTYIDIDTSYATATASDILAGYTAYVNGELITGSIPTYTGSTQFIPSSKDQTIKKGVYVKNTIIVSGDGNLDAKNIKKGIEIFGVFGTYDGK